MAKMKCKTKTKLKLLCRLVVSVFVVIWLTGLPWIDLEQILNQESDLQFNLISLSATIGGFLFAGISLFISTFESERIKTKWECGYLDKIYLGAFVGIFLNVLTIFAALAMVLMTLDKSIQLLILRWEIVLILTSLVFFVFNSFDLIRLLDRTKRD